MLNIKKSIMTVLAFSSSAVFAGTMGSACEPGNVTVPCVNSAWSFSGQALFLRPNFSGADFYGPIVNAPLGGNPTTITMQKVNDSWGAGFKLDGSYHFYTGNDLNLNWYHFANTTTGTITVPVGSNFTDPVNNSYIGVVNTSRKPTWDAVNLELGQHVDFSTRKKIRFHGGVQYVRINSQVSFNSPDSTETISASETLTYNGFGPRIGMDLSYQCDHGFAVYANGATALLIGPNQFSGTGVGTVAATWLTQSGSTIALVPELEAKLGATYTYSMAQGNLSLDAGWLWVNYFNAQQNINGSDTTNGIQQSDFGVQGPYVGLKWLSN